MRDRPLEAGPALSTVGFDRAALHREDERWLAEAWQRAEVVAITAKSATPVSRDGRLALRAPDELAAGVPRRLLGLVGDLPYFTVTVEAENGDWRTLREIGAGLDDLQAGLVTTAIALEQWHQRHTHCPQCGTPTVEAKAGWTRRCPADGSEHFPRTDPAVIMLILDGTGELALLGRGHDWAPGRYSTLAGFVEPGESLEAAVAREVFEEVGVGVTDIRYVASQPWPFPASLMLGFVARLDGDPSIHLDPVEMAEAHWFTRDEVTRAAERVDSGAASLLGAAGGPELTLADLPAGERLLAISPRLSISRYLIDSWLAGRLT